MEQGKMEAIKKFIEKCTLLKGGKVNVDYIKDKEIYFGQIQRITQSC